MENQRIKIMGKELNDVRKSLVQLTNEFYKLKMKPLLEDVLLFAQLKEVDQ